MTAPRPASPQVYRPDEPETEPADDDPCYPEGWWDDDGWNPCNSQADEAELEAEA